MGPERLIGWVLAVIVIVALLVLLFRLVGMA